MEKYHTSVLLEETINMLQIKSSGIYVDATLGGGGHSSEILKQLTNGLLIGLDKDMDAINFANHRLKEYGKNFVLAQTDYLQAVDILDQLEIEQIDGAVLDLGVSSFQLDQAERGFSFQKQAHLDMRMDQSQKIDADFVVNHYSQEKLETILRDNAEEKWAKKISEEIVKRRPIHTTTELAELVKEVIPNRVQGKIHPATKTFQAIRIEVNHELSNLEISLRRIFSRLKVNGRMAVITFHSLEDRIVKQLFKEYESSCSCPKELPICTCNEIQVGKRVNRKPIVASEEEVERNPRSRSAKLRVIEKIREEQ